LHSETLTFLLSNIVYRSAENPEKNAYFS